MHYRLNWGHIHRKQTKLYLIHAFLSPQDVSVDMDFVDLLEQIQKRRHLVCVYGNTLRHDETKKGNVARVLDTDDPVTVLFEYMKQKNLRLIDLLHNLDRDHSYTITRDEFQQGLAVRLRPVVVSYDNLKSIKIISQIHHMM